MRSFSLPSFLSLKQPWFWVIFVHIDPSLCLCRQPCLHDSMKTISFNNSARGDGGVAEDQHDDDDSEHVPFQSDAFASSDEKAQHTLPSTKRKRKEKRDTVLQTPVRRGQRKRTRSAVGQEWDLLVALKQHKAVGKSQQQQKSSKKRRGKGESDSKASTTRQ